MHRLVASPPDRPVKMVGLLVGRVYLILDSPLLSTLEEPIQSEPLYRTGPAGARFEVKGKSKKSEKEWTGR